MDIASLLLFMAALAVAFVATLALRRERAVARRRARMLFDLEAHLDALAQDIRETAEKASQARDRARTIEQPDAARERDTARAEDAVVRPSLVAAVVEGDLHTDQPAPGPPPDARVDETAHFAATRYYYAAEDDRPVGLAAVEPQSQPGSVPALRDRASFHTTLSVLVTRAREQEHGLAICVLDLDAFKLVNERIGWVGGDQVLAEIADVLGETVRPTDLMFRTGGDEFSVILPDSGRIDAESLFVRVQATVGSRDVVRDARVSFSAGVAQLEPDDDGVALFERAQRVLQRAKAAGKGAA